jgi:hypothetical protein
VLFKDKVHGRKVTAVCQAPFYGRSVEAAAGTMHPLVICILLCQETTCAPYNPSSTYILDYTLESVALSRRLRNFS